MSLNTGKQSSQMTTILNSQIDEEITIENIEVGKSYMFTLSGKKGTEIIEGEVTYKDDKLISLFNEYYGEAEIIINDFDKISVESLLEMKTLLIKDGIKFELKTISSSELHLMVSDGVEKDVIIFYLNDYGLFANIQDNGADKFNLSPIMQGKLTSDKGCIFVRRNSGPLKDFDFILTSESIGLSFVRYGDEVNNVYKVYNLEDSSYVFKILDTVIRVKRVMFEDDIKLEIYISVD